jgi:aryl-alcohol dehydrogenase-like predicted oxidoreductase
MEHANLALGTMFFGTRVDEPTSFDLLDRFVAAGGRVLDTANAYAFWVDPSGLGGQSEALIGRWLARRPGVRDGLVISTKVGAAPTAAGEWPASAEGLSAPTIKAAAEASLARLGTDRIDLYWTHVQDPRVPLEETAGALADLVADGTVGRLGCSNHPVWQVERARQIAWANGWAGYSAIQLRHSYVQPRPGAWATVDASHRFVTEDVLDYVRGDRELALWAYTALINGAYTRPDRPLPEGYHHPGTTRRLAVLAEVADELGVSRNQVVLAWLTGGDPPITPIVGVSTPAQLDEAVAGVALALPPEQRQRLDAAV